MNHIKKARLHRGLSQAELGKAVGLSASAIGMIEQGRRLPSLTTVGKLRDVLGYSITYLLGSDEDIEHFSYKEMPQEKNYRIAYKNQPREEKPNVLDYHGQPVVFTEEQMKVPSIPPIFKMLLMDDPELAKIVNATKVVGEHDVVSHGKLISISPAKLELFHAALKAILEIGG